MTPPGNAPEAGPPPQAKTRTQAESSPSGERVLDIKAAKKRILAFVDADADEGIIITDLTLRHEMTELIVHLWDAIAEVGRLRSERINVEHPRG